MHPDDYERRVIAAFRAAGEDLVRIDNQGDAAEVTDDDSEDV
jgi:hypothetical protein